MTIRGIVEVKDAGTIPSRLLMLRTREGLSQSAFAKILNIADKSYKNYETGVRDLPMAVAITILDKYALDANWLILGIKPDASNKGAEY